MAARKSLPSSLYNLCALQAQIQQAIDQKNELLLREALSPAVVRAHPELALETVITLAGQGEDDLLTVLLSRLKNVLTEEKKEALQEAFAQASWEGHLPCMQQLLPLCSTNLQACTSSLFASITRDHADGVALVLPFAPGQWYRPSGKEIELSALMLAAKAGHPELLSLLHQAGEDPRAVNRYGENGLFAAMSGHCPQSVRFFLDFCDPTLRSTRPGQERALGQAVHSIGKQEKPLPSAFWNCVDLLLPFEDRKTISWFVHHAPAQELPAARSMLERITLERSTKALPPPCSMSVSPIQANEMPSSASAPKSASRQRKTSRL